ncbi:MAG: type II CAAX endopeptidase family protein [Chloroflexota bacterium]
MHESTFSTTVHWRAVAIFTALAFGFAWLAFGLAAVFDGLDPERSNVWTVVAGVGVAFGPALAAMVMRFFVTREGLAEAGLRWRVAGRYYGWAILLPLAWGSAGVLLRLLVGGNTLDGFPPVQAFVGYLVSLLITWLILFGEEFGWRSYLLHYLSSLGRWRAVWLSSVVWAVWHLPFVVVPSFLIDDELGPPLLAAAGQIVFIVLLGVIIGWLYLSSRSVVVVMLLHAVSNTWGAFWDPYLAGVNPTYAQTVWMWIPPTLVVVGWLWVSGRLREPQPAPHTLWPVSPTSPI